MAVSFLLNISKAIKVNYDQVLLIGVMLLSIPFGLIHYLIRGPKLRMLYSLICGLFLQYCIFGFLGIFHTFAATTFTYLFIKHFGRNYSAFWVFCITFAHLSALSIEKKFSLFNTWTLSSPATVYMMLIPKYSSLAFSYEDGVKNDKEFINDHMRKYKVKHRPSFLEVSSFVYFYPTCIIGPSFDFKDYYDFIHYENCYSRIPFFLMMKKGVMYFVLTFLCMVVYAWLGKKFALDYIGSIEYNAHPLWYKIGYINIAMIAHRSKFYSGFILSYTSMLFCGIGYGETRKQKEHDDLKTSDSEVIVHFEKGSYGSIFDCELGLNPKTKITSWNHPIHLWLKYNLFLRLINVDNAFLKNNYIFASLMTFMASALWHGFYSTYYIFFFVMFIYQTGNEVFDKLGFFTYVSEQGSYPLKFVVWLYSQFMCNSLGAIFFILKYHLFIQYMKNIYLIPILLVVVTYGVSKFFIVKDKARNRSKANNKENTTSKPKED